MLTIGLSGLARISSDNQKNVWCRASMPFVSITFGWQSGENVSFVSIHNFTNQSRIVDMNKIFPVLIALSATLLTACAVPKQMTATGGSRSDGTVKLSYEYGKFEVPQVDSAQGVRIAKARCGAWGYSGAEAFGGTTKVCNHPSGSGCERWLVTTEYQCIGTPPSSK